MLCADCVADFHAFNSDGICEHTDGTRCTCEYDAADPEFNDRWAHSPHITHDELNAAALYAGFPAADRAGLFPHANAARYLALAEAHGFTIAS